MNINDYGTSDWPALPLLSDLVNKVHNCTAESMLSMLPDNSINMVLVSPPYDNVRTYHGFSWDFEYIAKQTYRVLKPGGVLVWVVGDGTVNGGETLTSMRQAIYFVDRARFRMHDTMINRDPGTAFPDPTRYTQQFEYMFVLSKGRPQTINLQLQRNKWAGDQRPEGSLKTQQEVDGSRSTRKRKPVKEYGVMGNVWEIGTGYGKSTKDKIAFEHPAIFPEELVRRHIETWSRPGQIVLDYFGGSGTTAKIARNLGRQFITNDISPAYCDLITRRLSEPYTPSFMHLLESAG